MINYAALNIKTYGEWLIYWIKNKQNIKETTRSAYFNLIRLKIIPKLGETPISDISKDKIKEFFSDCCNVQQLQDTSLTIIKAILINSWNTLYDIDDDYDDNALKLKKPKKTKQSKPIEVFSKADELKILNAVFASTKLIDVGIGISLLTGLRIGEVCALKWSAINLNEKKLYVNLTVSRNINVNKKKTETNLTQIILSSPKSDSSIRYIPITSTLSVLLERIKPIEMDSEVFVLSGTKTPVEPRSLRQHFSLFLINNNITRKNFHALRHTFATHWISAGLDVKRLSMILGHSSINITLDRYVHPSFEDLQDSMDKYNSEVIEQNLKEGKRGIV